MLTYLLQWSPVFTGFNLFKYLTFRTMGALLTALILSFCFGGPFIRMLKRLQKDGQPIRLDGPEGHLITKKGTPTMGGALILGVLLISTILWADIHNVYIWITLGVIMSFGLLGMADDYLKLTKRSSKGVSGKVKLLVQGGIALLATFLYMHTVPSDYATGLMIPFAKELIMPLGWFFVPFSLCVIVGSSNAVNLTDGLDGLAIVPVMIASICFCIIAYVVGHSVFAHYLQLPLIPGAGELSVLCGAFIGAGLGFLWFNAPPAKVFMGDTGSLAAGGALGTIAMITKHELVLFIIGGLFVVEACSVILQVVYYKLTKKRIFLMAPIHHHFEKKGWKEPTIVIRFWIIASILGIIGLATLKLR